MLAGMLDATAPFDDLDALLEALARLRLDRLYPQGCGATILGTGFAISRHDALLELLVTRRTWIVDRAGVDALAVASAVGAAESVLHRVEPLLADSRLGPSHRSVVLRVLRELVRSTATALAARVAVPPLWWAAWQAMMRCNAVTGLDARELGDRSASQLLREGFRVDAGSIDDTGIPALVGARIDAAWVVPSERGGHRLHLRTRARGAWVIGPDERGLCAELWDFVRPPAPPPGLIRVHRDLGVVQRTFDPLDPEHEELRLGLSGGGGLVVRRPVWGETRPTFVGRLQPVLPRCRRAA